MGRFDVNKAQKQQGIEKAKHFCIKAAEAFPKDPIANMHVRAHVIEFNNHGWQMGLLFQEALDFPASIEWLLKARKHSPNDSNILSNLANAYSRQMDSVASQTR